MALIDETPHSVTVYGPPTTARDGGGGETVTWPTVRTVGVGGLLNTLSGSEREMFAQQNLVVSHKFGTQDTTAQRGDKLVYGSRSFKIEGIQTGEAWGSFPVLSYLILLEIL